MKPRKRNYTVYFASELFSPKHLIGDAYLAEAIYEKSHGKYLCILPQNIEQRRTGPQHARDVRLQTLLECDFGLFSNTGPELTPGTAEEFMFAKFADIPSVILRGDSRPGHADNKTRGLMADCYPRTSIVRLSSIGLYKTAMRSRLRASRGAKPNEIVRLAGQHSSAHAQTMCERVAEACVAALDHVGALDPVMPKHLREEVYQWLALMPDFKGKPKALRRKFESFLEHKVEHDLL